MGFMNYIYSVLLLHSAGKELTEGNVSKVVEATGEKADPAQVKALIASLGGVNIEDAIKQAVVSAAPASAAAPAPEKKEEKKEDEGKKAEEAAAGLSGLFG